MVVAQLFGVRGGARTGPTAYPFLVRGVGRGAPRGPRLVTKNTPRGGVGREGACVAGPGVPVVERVGIGWGHHPCVCVRAQWRGC